jgi:predicted permease
MYVEAGLRQCRGKAISSSGGKQMLIWAVLPILVFAVLASGPFRDSIPAAAEPFAQLAAVLSLFVLVCAVEAGGQNQDKGK